MDPVAENVSLQDIHITDQGNRIFNAKKPYSGCHGIIMPLCGYDFRNHLVSKTSKVPQKMSETALPNADNGTDRRFFDICCLMQKRTQSRGECPELIDIRVKRQCPIG